MKLKPCPFCGSEDVHCDDVSRGCDMWFVQCYECFATFPHFDSKYEAIEAWNRRANDDRP